MWVLVIWKVSTEWLSQKVQREVEKWFSGPRLQYCWKSTAHACIRVGPSAAFLQQFESHQQHFAFLRVDVSLAAFVPLGKNNTCVWLARWFDMTKKENSSSFLDRGKYSVLVSVVHAAFDFLSALVLLSTHLPLSLTFLCDVEIPNRGL